MTPVAPPPASGQQYERLIAYYENAGPDYGAWSSGFNMHFGYYRPGLNPFRRESMLDEMNRQVLARLSLDREGQGLVLDLGCGVGATVRTAASQFPSTRILGITIVPWQVETGNAWNCRLGLFPRARLELGDYTCTGLPSSSADGAVAIESACHAEGPDKIPFVREAARLLRRGARLVVADAFLKNPDRPLGPISARLNALLNSSFVLPQLPQIESFAAALGACGFEDVTVEDISWRVAPSVMYAPYVVSSFVLSGCCAGSNSARHEKQPAGFADVLAPRCQPAEVRVLPGFSEEALACYCEGVGRAAR